MSKIARPINLTAAVAILAALLITAGPAAAQSAGWPDPPDPFISSPYVAASQDLRSPDARTPVVDLTPPSTASLQRDSSGGVDGWLVAAIASLVLAGTVSVLLVRERRRRRPMALGS